MKTAVWMTGGMRSHWKERCLKSFKEKILDVLDCDLYISTARTQGGEEETIKEIYPDAKLNYITEVDEIPGGPNIPIQTNDDIVQCLTWYRIWDARRMMEESGVQYDLVIRVRPDLEYRGNFPFFVFNPSHICWIYQHPWKQKNLMEYDDRFAVGSLGIMLWYSELYNHLPEYKKGSKFGINQNNSEHNLFCHMDQYKVAHFILNNELEQNHFHIPRDGETEGIDCCLAISSIATIRDNDPDLPPENWKDFVPFKDQWRPF